MEKKRYLPSVSYGVFFTYQPPYKLTKMEQFLEHLKIYETKTRALIKNDPENKKFYEEHYRSVIDLLEKMEQTEQSERDFTLVTPQTEYIKKFPQIYEKSKPNPLPILLSGLTLLAVLTISILIAMLILGPQILLLALLATLLTALLIMTVATCITILAADAPDEPLANSYLAGKAFNCNLLEEAYTELHQEVDSANDAVIFAEPLSRIK
ncbi:MAG: hypothetical protein H0U57_01525 [Tatlockia sp.]|nr:hypothetical protein [Tatlockia sp.]